MISLARLRLALQAYAPPLNPKPPKRASVLIPLTEREGRLEVLLTLRAAHLRSHSGQVAFPGGKEDEADFDAYQAALREAEEEIGLPPNQVEYLGQLDQIISRQYYLVTPFIGLIPAEFQAQANPDEIENVFSVPLEFFMHPEVHRTEEFRRAHFRHLSHHFFYREYDIWGLTAALLLRLLEIGFGWIPPYPVHASESPSWMELAQRFDGQPLWD